MDAIETEALVQWPAHLRAELAANDCNARVGTRLVSQDARVRVWLLELAPGERLPFHRHVLDYFWTVTSPGGGRGRSHYGDGRVQEVEYALGDTKHLNYAPGCSMIHDLENIGTETLSFVTVEFFDSANPPLPV